MNSAKVYSYHGEGLLPLPLPCLVDLLVLARASVITAELLIPKGVERLERVGGLGRSRVTGRTREFYFSLRVIAYSMFTFCMWLNML